MISDNSSLVSVIVPIYNAETFLAQCLDSIAEQSYRNLEIICINDGSTDGSLAILQDYAKMTALFSSTSRTRAMVPVATLASTALEANGSPSSNPMIGSILLCTKKC